MSTRGYTPHRAGAGAARVLFLYLAGAASAALAQEPSGGTRPPVVPDLQPVTVTATKKPAPEGADACDRTRGVSGLPRVTQELLRSAACHSFRWFDGLFGDREEFDASQVSGRMTAGADYTEYDEFDPRLRLRVRAPLPNLSSRWDLLLGREDEDAYIRDTQPQDETFYNPGLIPRDDPEWLLGLGKRRRDARKGWDYSVGVRVRAPPRPYAKVQYYYNEPLSDRTELRLRQTFYWRSDEGFGTTSRGDLSHAVNFRNVLRWEGVATMSEERDGVFWYAGQTWYRLLESGSAVSLLGFMRGETRADVRLQEYGLNLIWRKPVESDWLYLSMGPSITWPRYEADERRDLSLGFGAWIEIQFGDYRY